MFDKYSNSFLRDFNVDTLLEKFPGKQFLNFSKGEVIFRENDFIVNVHFILTGEVNICRAKSESEYKYEKISVAKTGDIIGLDEVLYGDHYVNSSFAEKDTNIIAVTKHDFLELTKTNDEFNLWVLKYLSHRINVLS